MEPKKRPTKKPAAPKPAKTATKPGEPRKKPGTLSYKTRQAIKLAVDHAVDPKDAYTLTNGRPPSKDALSRLKDKVRKHSLTAPGMVKLAHQAVKDTLEGKEARYDAVKVFSNGRKETYQEVIVPSYTNKLAAAAMVYDRVEPLKGQQGGQAPQFVQVNLHLALNPHDAFSVTETATEKPVVDITPCDTK